MHELQELWQGSAVSVTGCVEVVEPMADVEGSGLLVVSALVAVTTWRVVVVKGAVELVAVDVATVLVVAVAVAVAVVAVAAEVVAANVVEAVVEMMPVAVAVLEAVVVTLVVAMFVTVVVALVAVAAVVVVVVVDVAVVVVAANVAVDVVVEDTLKQMVSCAREHAVTGVLRPHEEHGTQTVSSPPEHAASSHVLPSLQPLQGRQTAS